MTAAPNNNDRHAFLRKLKTSAEAIAQPRASGYLFFSNPIKINGIPVTHCRAGQDSTSYVQVCVERYRSAFDFQMGGIAADLEGNPVAFNEPI
jgi:hypothetical protein